MNRIVYIVLTAGIATMLGACASTPKQPIEELEAARTLVPQVEASPRAGAAAENVSAARQSLDRANKLMTTGGKVDDIRFESQVASRQAQIANEKILNAQAKDEITHGEAERQAAVLEARNREADLARQRAASLEEELKDLKAKRTDRGVVLTLGDVLFDTGKATLKPGAYQTIDRLAEMLKEVPGRKVQIEGHTDNTGSDETNQLLSQRRADAVAAALMQRGVSSDQISATGKGEGYPVASNNSATGRQQNRRVEMIFTDSSSRVASDSN